MSQELSATIGDGIEIKASTIPCGGNGLWTTRLFLRNELITEYCGPIIDHKRALELRRKKKHSHIRVLNSQHSYIDGIKVPKQGQGGASFANDARDSQQQNSVFVCKHDRRLGRDRVFLKATRDLEPGTEVFVGYGRSYWALCKGPPTQPGEQQSSPQQQQPPQQPQRQQRKRTRNQHDQQQQGSALPASVSDPQRRSKRHRRGSTWQQKQPQLQHQQEQQQQQQQQQSPPQQCARGSQPAGRQRSSRRQKQQHQHQHQQQPSPSVPDTPAQCWGPGKRRRGPRRPRSDTWQQQQHVAWMVQTKGTCAATAAATAAQAARTRQQQARLTSWQQAGAAAFTRALTALLSPQPKDRCTQGAQSTQPCVPPAAAAASRDGQQQMQQPAPGAAREHTLQRPRAAATAAAAAGKSAEADKQPELSRRCSMPGRALLSPDGPYKRSYHSKGSQSEQQQEQQQRVQRRMPRRAAGSQTLLAQDHPYRK